MKKQILILTMLTLALIFSSLSHSYGQSRANSEENYIVGGTLYCPPAVTLTCADGDGLSPVPGVEYTYEISASSMSTVHWIVTDAANVMTGPGALTAASPVGGDYVLTNPDGFYDDPANTSASITLSWKSFNGNANNVLLVAYVWDATSCTDNIEVYRIIPQYSFTLDLAGILDDGTVGATECVGNIQSAQYDGTLRELTVTYGNNFVFFAVNAANWQTSWMPDLTAVSDFVNSNITSVTWAYPDEAIAAAGPWNATTVEVEASHYGANPFIGQTGACIIVRVEVTHGITTENISNETITLSADGEMLNPETLAYDGAYPDLDEPANTGDPCVNDYTDTATYIITPRPDINEVAPAPFETKVPTGN